MESIKFNEYRETKPPTTLFGKAAMANSNSDMKDRGHTPRERSTISADEYLGGLTPFTSSHFEGAIRIGLEVIGTTYRPLAIASGIADKTPPEEPHSKCERGPSSGVGSSSDPEGAGLAFINGVRRRLQMPCDSVKQQVFRDAA